MPGAPSRLASIPFAVGVGVVLLALAGGIATYLILTGATPLKPTRNIVIWLLGLNLVLVLAMLGMIGWQIYHLWKARRAGIAGARLHVRLVSLFSMVAVLPALVVAIFASVTLDRGLDAWFSERTRAIITNAQTVAEAYVNEHAKLIRGDIVAMASDLNRNSYLFLSDPGRFSQLLTNQAAVRGMPAVFLVNEKGVDILHVIADEKQLHISPPPPAAIAEAKKGKTVVLPPNRFSVVRALIKLKSFTDTYLYVLRPVDPKVIRHLMETRAKRREYNALEGRRYGVQVTFGLMYVGLSLIFLLAAIWFGLGVASYLVTPIGGLIAAAQRVAEGDLDVSLPVRRKEGDIGSLARAFNRMAAQLKKQRRELLDASRQIDERRRFTEAVLAGVTPGVIGLNASGAVRLVNTSACTLLGQDESSLIGSRLAESHPAFAPLLEKAMTRHRDTVQDHITMTRDGATLNLLVRVTQEREGAGKRGFVVTFDDITDLIIAQRSSAWADIARRIAHEIKNPLTPIQLSAERLKRKYLKEITSDREVFEKCTDTIVRQVGDIRAMVDEFSSFARMPKAVLEKQEVRTLVREAVFLQKVGLPHIDLKLQLPEHPVTARLDARLFGQALTNLIKNAGEAIETANMRGEGPEKGRIDVKVTSDHDLIHIDIIDNGCGLPRENRQRLIEPYMTTREKGTGLGLAIVAKIMEDHGGSLKLLDAPAVRSGGHGAMLRMTLPALHARNNTP